MFHIELPDGSYTLVPDGEDEGADAGVHYVTVEQDQDQSLEEPKASFAEEGKPRSSLPKLFPLNIATIFI